MGLSMKHNLLGITGLILISAIVLSIALPVVASASTIIQVPSLSQETNTTTVNTSTAFGVEALIAVLEFNVRKVEALFIKWNVTDNESWSKLREINDSISEVKSLLDEGNITGARTLAIELLQELAKLVRDAAMVYGNATGNMSRKQLELMVQIRAMNKTIDILLNASVKLESMNKTLAAMYNDTLVQARIMLREALKLVLENNTSGAEELLDKVKDLVDKAREMLRESVMVRVKEHVREHIDKMVEELNKTIMRLEELAQRLEEEGLTYAAQAVQNATERLKSILDELLNTTRTLVNETIPPEILVKVYENMVHDIKEMNHHVNATEDYAEKVREIHGSFKHLDTDKANLSVIMNAMKNMAPMLPSQAQEKLNAMNAKMSELDQAMKELERALQTCNGTLIEQAQERVLTKINEMKQLASELRESMSGDKGKQQNTKPFMSKLDEMEQALTRMQEEVKSIVHEALRKIEECREIIVNATVSGLRELKRKINNTVEMLKECKHCPTEQAIQVRVKLEEAYKLVIRAEIQLQANNTSLALKLLVQAKNTVEESLSLGKHLPKYIRSEIERTKSMIEALIEQLED